MRDLDSKGRRPRYLDPEYRIHSYHIVFASLKKTMEHARLASEQNRATVREWFGLALGWSCVQVQGRSRSRAKCLGVTSHPLYIPLGSFLYRLSSRP
jgi:hypothetical protein